MDLTIKVKLLPSQEQKNSLLKTMAVFNKACDYISQTAYKNGNFHKFALQQFCYKTIRKRFGLSAQLTVRAIGKVCESYKVERERLHRFKKDSAIVYDQRILSFKNLETISILTIDGRCKNIPMVFGKHINIEQYKIQGQADLIYKRNKFYLCLVVDVPAPPVIAPVDYIGVDMGIINLAATSDGNTYSGHEVDAVRQRMTKIKKSLQQCGSKSAKRHLKKLSGRERRFKRNVNHVIAKRLLTHYLTSQ